MKKPKFLNKVLFFLKFSIIMSLVVIMIVSCQISVDTDNPNDETTHPITVLTLDEAWTEDLSTGTTWFSIELNEEGKYLLEWLEGFTGTVEMYEDDKTTGVPFIVASGRGDNFKVVDVTTGKYFIKIYSSSNIENFKILIVECNSVTFAWDPNIEPDLAGYKIYWGYATHDYTYNLDVGNVTTGTITGLLKNTTYYIAVTAYNTDGNESDFSNEVVYESE